MDLRKYLRRIFLEPAPPTDFSIEDRGEPGIPGGGEDVVDGHVREEPPFATGEQRRYRRRRILAHGKHREATRPRPEDALPPPVTPFGGMSESERELLGNRLSRRLEKNKQAIMRMFHAPRNEDLILREFAVASSGDEVEAALFTMQGISDPDAVERVLLRAILQLNTEKVPYPITVDTLRGRLIPERSVRTAVIYSEVVEAIVEGNTVIMVQGEAKALICETQRHLSRPLSESITEAVVRGPHTSFVENLITNKSLIRTMLATPKLVAERIDSGAFNHAAHAILYIDGITNPKLVDEVRRRMASIKVGTLLTNEMVANYIGDRPASPFPAAMMTERPDRVASMILEGHVAILNESPSAVVVPVTLWSLMQSAEDYYVNPLLGSFLRLVRWTAMGLALFLSPLYVAVVTFHPEMVPTQLLLSLAATREPIPFPAFVEVLVLESAFELIREAGIRIPNVIGPTIGIVGAVILGQAAVQARIISPIMVVLVAISGLGVFAVPDYSLGLLVRVTKYVLMIVAGILGIPGLTMAAVFLLTNLLSLRSFGVPVTAPVLPSQPHAADAFWRASARAMWRRPAHTRPPSGRRHPKQAPVAEMEAAGDRRRRSKDDEHTP